MANTKRSANKVGRYRNHMMIVSLLALVLAIGCTVGGTLAWIVSVPEPVVNTFTYGDIEITLEETDSPIDGEEDPENQNTYMMVPGAVIHKDPKVTVLKGSETCWLFVKLDESDNFGDFMTYTIADGWTALVGEDGVYYRKAEASDTDAEIGVLKDDKVTVKETVTDEQLNALGSEDGANPYPTLNITAYAVQYLGFEHNDTTTENAAALSAWNAAQGEVPPTDNSNSSTSSVSDDAAAANASLYYWGEDSIFTIDPQQ